jgi:hypothetical protein
MPWIPYGIALLVALGIIAIGALYILVPGTMSRSFGLPPPDNGAGTAWWLRLKGVRDIATGLAVLTFMAWGAPRALGLILLVFALIPMGDMLLILAAKGSTRHALGIHGLTATAMVAAVALLPMGGH